jgi:hypothetical protein
MPLHMILNSQGVGIQHPSIKAAFKQHIIMTVALVVKLPNDRINGFNHSDKVAVLLVKFLNQLNL